MGVVALRRPSRIDRRQVQTSFTSTDGWTTRHRDSQPADLTAQGWRVTAQIPGFREITEVKRAFGNSREVGQIVMSDGLASISVFVEPAGTEEQAEGDASKGPINVSRRRLGDFWLTIVGEAPAATIRQLAESVTRLPGK